MDKTAAPTLHRMGETGLIVEFAPTMTDAANRAALAFRSEVEAAGLEAVEETLVTLKSCVLRFDPDKLAHAELEARIGDLLGSRDWLDAPLPDCRKLWHIPAAFGGKEGPQLAEMADLAGQSERAMVDDMASTRLRVLTIGFAPGQPYLGMLPPPWDVPRQAGLTPQVPKGAIVAAIRQIVLFAVAAQTGWRQIGLSAFEGYRPQAAEPFPLTVGDEVVFEPVSSAELARWQDKVAQGELAARSEPLA